MADETGDRGDTLTGVWNGQFDYPAALKPVHFVATLIDMAGRLSGTTHETGADGRGVASRLATIDGACSGANVRFLKVYSPASEEYQDVIYDGALNADRTEISGTWSIPGEWSGSFLMIRAGKQAKARSRRKRASV